MSALEGHAAAVVLVPLQLLLSFDYDCKSAASARMTISMVVWLFGMARVDKKMADALLESCRQLCRCGFVIDWNGFTYAYLQSS